MGDHVVGTFDEADLRYRVTLWTLEAKTKTMTKRLQRQKTLFNSATNELRRELHTSPGIRQRASLLAELVLQAESARHLSFNIYKQTWITWYRGLVSAADADLFARSFCTSHYERDCRNGATLDCVADDTAVDAVINFAHMWCDEVDSSGYIDFFQSMHSIVESFQLNSSRDASSLEPCRTDQSSPGSKDATNPDGTPGMPSIAHQPPTPLSVTGLATPRRVTGIDTASPSAAGTPGAAPLSRAWRVSWVPGDAANNHVVRRPLALFERHFSPSERRESAEQSDVSDGVSRLDSNAQLRLWSPDAAGTVPKGPADSLLDDDIGTQSLHGPSASPWSLAMALHTSNANEMYSPSAALPTSIGYAQSLPCIGPPPLRSPDVRPSRVTPTVLSMDMPPSILANPASSSMEHWSMGPQEVPLEPSRRTPVAASRPLTSSESPTNHVTPSNRAATTSPSIGDITPVRSSLTSSVTPRAGNLRCTPIAAGATSPSVLPLVGRRNVYSIPKSPGSHILNAPEATLKSSEERSPD